MRWKLKAAAGFQAWICQWQGIWFQRHRFPPSAIARTLFIYFLFFNSKVYLNDLNITRGGYRLYMVVCKVDHFNWSCLWHPKKYTLMLQWWQIFDSAFHLLFSKSGLGSGREVCLWRQAIYHTHSQVRFSARQVSLKAVLLNNHLLNLSTLQEGEYFKNLQK